MDAKKSKCWSNQISMTITVNFACSSRRQYKALRAYPPCNNPAIVSRILVCDIVARRKTTKFHIFRHCPSMGLPIRTLNPGFLCSIPRCRATTSCTLPKRRTICGPSSSSCVSARLRCTRFMPAMDTHYAFSASGGLSAVAMDHDGILLDFD
jgi:hypothetical protein